MIYINVEGELYIYNHCGDELSAAKAALCYFVDNPMYSITEIENMRKEINRAKTLEELRLFGYHFYIMQGIYI